MIVNFISETEFFAKDQGVHTAYLTIADMARKEGLDVLVNSFKKADIVHIHTIGIFGLFKLKMSKNTVVTAHLVPDSFVGSLKGTNYWLGIAKWYLRYFYNSSDLVFAVAPRVKEQLIDLGVKSRIEVLPNPVNDDLFKKSETLRDTGRKKLNLDHKDFVAIGVGQLQPRKGVSDFITLAKRFPKIKFIWVGGKPFKALTADNSELNKLLLNPPSNFFIKGPFAYKDMPYIFNAADVFLFPSFQENAPMALIEAAACELPLILRNNPEYLTLYNDGYIACNNIQEFYSTINKLQKDGEYYNSASGESAMLAKKFGERVIAGKMVKFYNSLLSV